jgi:hypothetical protein
MDQALKNCEVLPLVTFGGSHCMRETDINKKHREVFPYIPLIVLEL